MAPMKRYAVEIEVEAYASSREKALARALETVRNLVGTGMRVEAWTQETNERGVPLMDRESKRTVLSKGARS